MNEILECIKTRRSVKKYKSEMPKRADIEAIVEAGIYAASGRNMQAPIIIAVTDKKLRDELMRANAEVLGTSSDPFYNAPLVLVVLAKKDVRTYVYDGSLAMGNMMLAAHSLGLGACWIHRAREVFSEPKWQKWLSELGFDGEYEGIGNLIVGYPDGDLPEAKPRLEHRTAFV